MHTSQSYVAARRSICGGDLGSTCGLCYDAVCPPQNVCFRVASVDTAATIYITMAVIPISTPSERHEETEDIELNDIAGVVSREAGERDPLLLRSKIISDSTLDGLKE